MANILPEIDNYGTKQWYNNNRQYHRDNDLPAVIYADGSKEWYQNGWLHRDNDLPAIIHDNGDQYWFQFGQLHRDNDLPAIVYANGSEDWYQNGIQLTYDEVKIIIKHKLWKRDNYGNNYFQWLPIEMNVITDELLKSH